MRPTAARSSRPCFLWLLLSCCIVPFLSPDPALPGCKSGLHPLGCRSARGGPGGAGFTKAKAAISAKPGFRRALPRVLRGCRVGGAAGAFARDSPAAPERCEPVRLGGRAWDSQGGVPLGRGHGARSPMRDAAPFGGLSRRKGQAALRSRRKHAGNPWREGCRGPGCPGARGRVPRSRGAAASWEHRGGGAGCCPSVLRGSAATRWTPRTSPAC